MRGPEKMASDSEPGKFFSRAPRGPSEVTFREAINQSINQFLGWPK